MGTSEILWVEFSLDVSVFTIWAWRGYVKKQQDAVKTVLVSALGTFSCSVSLINRNDLSGPCSCYFVPGISPQRLLPGCFKKCVWWEGLFLWLHSLLIWNPLDIIIVPIGNPHSHNPSSRLTHDTMERVRYRWSLLMPVASYFAG